MNEIISKQENSEVLNFDFEGHEVRMVVIDGEPWFVGNDIANALGYRDNTSALRNVDKEDKISRWGSFSTTLGGKHAMTIINESGMYTLIMSSKLQTDNVKRFKRWVTKDILPSIRKTGGYIMGQEKMTDEELVARALVVANNRLLEVEQRNQELVKENIEKSSFVELMSGSKDRYLTTEIANYYGLSAMKFNRLLNELKIQKKVGKMWTLRKQYEDKEFMIETIKKIYENKEVVERRTFNAWSKEGVKFIYYKLKDHGILPIMEREITNELIVQGSDKNVY